MDTRNELRGFLKQSKTTSEINNEVRVRTKRSSHSRRKECVKESLEDNDELVKYMSKLPGYLQRMERKEESVQSNVLNVGVLDWGRLEKWKHVRGRSGERSGKSERKVSTFATTSTSTSGVVPNESHRCKIDDQLHTCSNLGKVKASSRDLQHSVHGVRCTLEPDLASRDSLNKQEIATCSYKSSSGRDHEGVNPVKCRRSRSYRESASGLLSEMGNSGAKGNLVGRDKETQKKAGEIHSQEPRERAAKSGKQCVGKLDGEEKIVGDLKAGFSSENQEFSDIVLLRSRKQSQSTISGEPQMSLDDDNMRVTREVNRSVDFSDGSKSSLGLNSQIPRSCPISFDFERDSEDILLPLGVDLSGKKERFGGRRHSKTASRIFDLEMPEDESRKIRHSSPSKRFSFSFGRLSSRSFTFKENSAGLPLSSSDDTIKSDSMRFNGLAACPSQSSNPEKQIIHSGSRVSPLRRLLDPLLKSKGSENVIPSKSRSSSSNPTNNDVRLQDEKERDTSRTRALFQITIRNGIPLYQFLVDDNNNGHSSSRRILGATMKSLASSFKDDSVQYCTFYSVNEVKKKKSGSWLIHGHKEKQCGFVYNVIGQMQLSNSMSSDITEQKFENNSPVMRESVLFDEAEQVKGRKEVAAVVIKKKPVEENYKGLEETSVIIPGGVHTFPEKGAPSPLISRWRSGGLCDCGGWDVGCKLYVLSNKTLLRDEFDQSFKLFEQEGSEQESGGPALAMTELKTGIYRVEFSSFISTLQAFFVCLTVITCASEAKTTGKSSSPLAPPLSPVGRV